MTETTHAFVEHTLDSAPAEARRSLQAVVAHQGHLPPAAARMASSPQLLEGFLKASALFESTTLDAVAREVLVMTVAVRNGCQVCIAMHTARLESLDADAELIAALRDQRPLADDRLEAMRVFTIEVVTRTGAVAPEALRSFLTHGYTTRNALEVVLGIGAYTMSTLANRLTETPAIDQLTPAGAAG